MEALEAQADSQATEVAGVSSKWSLGACSSLEMPSRYLWTYLWSLFEGDDFRRCNRSAIFS